MRHLSIEKQCDIVHVYTYFLARISSPKTNKTPKLICVLDQHIGNYCLIIAKV